MRKLDRQAQRIVDAGREAAIPSAQERARAWDRLHAGALGSAMPTVGADLAQLPWPSGAEVGTLAGVSSSAAIKLAVVVTLGGGAVAAAVVTSDPAAAPEVSRPAPEVSGAAPAIGHDVGPGSPEPEAQAAAQSPAPVERSSGTGPAAGAVAPDDPRPMPRARRTAPRAEPVPPPDPAASLRRERGLIARANEAHHRGDPRATLRLVDDHASAFLDGLLSEEREVLRILALCDLGRAREARAELGSFADLYPSSSHGARLRRSCAGRSGPAIQRPSGAPKKG